MNVIDDEMLEGQIPEFNGDEAPATKQKAEPVEPAKDTAPEQHESLIGTKISFMPGSHEIAPDQMRDIDEKLQGSTKLGENMYDTAEARVGWIMINKNLLKEREIYYPEDWQFKIRPATVEAIRNWSAIDDQNALSVDETVNEMIKNCVAITSSAGPIPWGNIRSWDRFFFLNMVHEYTFKNGEHKVEYDEDCPNCDNPVKFTLTSQSLMWELPDPEVMKYFDKTTQTWIIDPEEFDVNWPEPITLYLPTLEKDAAIRQWAVSRLQDNKKVDNVFIKFLIWMAPKISKDETIANRQIKEYEMKFKSWNTEMFSFMNDVINNISVTPLQKLITKCPICGEEVTSQIKFQNGVRDLFSVSGGHKKFGKK